MATANGLDPKFPGSVTALSTTAIIAGGSIIPAFQLGGLGAPAIFFGSGVPTVSAANGSLYLRTDGTTTNDRMYVNTNGTTTWTACTTVA